MNILRWVERLTPEGRAAQLKRDAEEAFGSFPNDVWEQLLERMDGDAALHPHEVLQQIVAEQRRKHPLHWLKFRSWSLKRNAKPVGKYEQKLRELLE